MLMPSFFQICHRHQGRQVDYGTRCTRWRIDCAVYVQLHVGIAIKFHFFRPQLCSSQARVVYVVFVEVHVRISINIHFVGLSSVYLRHHSFCDGLREQQHFKGGRDARFRQSRGHCREYQSKENTWKTHEIKQQDETEKIMPQVKLQTVNDKCEQKSGRHTHLWAGMLQDRPWAERLSHQDSMELL